MGFIKFDQKYESPCHAIYWSIILCTTLIVMLVGQVLPGQVDGLDAISNYLCMPAVDYVKFMVFFILAYTVYLDMSGENSLCGTKDWGSWISIWLSCLTCTGITIFGCSKLQEANYVMYFAVIYLCSSTMSCTKNLLESEDGIMDGGFWKGIGKTLNPTNWF
jgi:hypothetical protein